MLSDIHNGFVDHNRKWISSGDVSGSDGHLPADVLHCSGIKVCISILCDLVVRLNADTSRIYCRYVVRNFGLDDIFALAALASITALAIMNVIHVSLGTGY